MNTIHFTEGQSDLELIKEIWGKMMDEDPKYHDNTVFADFNYRLDGDDDYIDQGDGIVAHFADGSWQMYDFKHQRIIKTTCITPFREYSLEELKRESFENEVIRKDSHIRLSAKDAWIDAMCCAAESYGVIGDVVDNEVVIFTLANGMRFNFLGECTVNPKLEA